MDNSWILGLIALALLSSNTCLLTNCDNLNYLNSYEKYGSDE